MTFADWIAARESTHRPEISQSYCLLPTISATGRRGITRRELGKRFDLEPGILDQLLAALVGVGLVTAVRQGGQIVFRAV
jgi:hypothetical protein